VPKILAELAKVKAKVIETQAGEDDGGIGATKLGLFRRDTLCFKRHCHWILIWVETVLHILALFQAE
jgi:hypothetical protein